MAAIISSFSGGAVLTSRSLSGCCISATVVGGGLFRTLLKCSVHLASFSASMVSNLPCLSTIGRRPVRSSAVLAADKLGDLAHLSLFSLVGGLFCLICQVFCIGPFVCPCHPLYCSVYFSVLPPVSLFQPLRSGVHDLLLQGSPALDGLPCICCDPFLPFLLSASQAVSAGLCIDCSDLLPHGVDVACTGVCFSASANA